MKNLFMRLLSLACLLLLTTAGFTQNSVMVDVNAQLRGLFSPLAKPSSSLPFLYDMAAHQSDSALFVTANANDTIVTDMWYSIYQEMYHAAYDTTPLATIEDVVARGNNFENDTIPLGILNYAMYTFKDSALNSNIYFNFDTINDILTDKYPRPSYPYDNGEIFIAAPLVNACYFSDPVFRIDAQFIFSDAFTASHFTSSYGTLSIDFGDGNGWIPFSSTGVTNYQVTYSTGGEKTIKTAVIDAANQVRMYSMSRIIVGPRGHDGVHFTPIAVPGLNVGLFEGCAGSNIAEKTVIYLEGIDVLDAIHSKNRGIAKIYSEMLASNQIIQLKNEGYNFIVVDWQNSRIDIRYNALYLMNLLEQLKCSLHTKQQFVIMGESMGGLVGRYALTYMETEEYTTHDLSPFFTTAADVNNVDYLNNHPDIFNLPLQRCDDASMHQTRLFITLDTPHQGANIPMAIQYAYRQAMGVIGTFVNPQWLLTANAANLFLDSQAAQEMLIYHIDTKTGAGPNWDYTTHPDKDDFFNQLGKLGNYPRYAKVVALSNGSLLGTDQHNEFLPQLRTANDRLLDFNSNLFIRVLHTRVPLVHNEVLARTNPNGNGQILSVKSAGFHLRIKLKRWKLKVNWVSFNLLSISESANLLPYCTSAGGHLSDLGISGPTNTFGPPWSYVFLDLFNMRQFTNDANGCIIYEARAGINGFVTQNFEYSVCTDGINFGFVPVQSALDYGTLGTIP